jgi:hypothetical protein
MNQLSSGNNLPRPIGSGVTLPQGKAAKRSEARSIN